uniref:Putative vacuolar sorting protein vps24 n=1 Tax=Anopheles triannulatus TaxID=58253 RepID=A0A2M4AN02_9DIPT
MGLFGKSSERNPKDMVQEWSSKLRKESFALDRQIRSIQREEDKIKRTLKEAAKKNDKEVCTILAKELIRSRKAVNKIYTSKAHINSVQLQMKKQRATINHPHSTPKENEPSQARKPPDKPPKLTATTHKRHKETSKPARNKQMTDEKTQPLKHRNDMEQEAQKEIDNVLWEITAGKLGEAPATPQANPNKEEPTTSQVAEEEDDEEDMKEMQSRLEALRS